MMKKDLFLNKLKCKKVISGLLVGCMILGMAAIGIASYSKSTTDSLSKELIRFHVVANSDTTEDQLLKQKVRDEIIAFIEPLSKECENLAETKELIEASLPVMKEIAEAVIAEAGKDYPVYVALDKANFPTKAYGDIILPAGEYEACRIVIGQGKGENWWCVMYPPLCYLDVASGVVPLEGKEQLQEQLNDEQYKLIDQGGKGGYHVRFKIVDSVNAWINGSDYKNKGIK